MNLRRLRPVKRVLLIALIAVAFRMTTPLVNAQVRLLAVGSLDRSRAGVLSDLSGLNYNLENGAPANTLGGFGSAITYAGNYTFLALPDRGPNAVPYDSNVDDTDSYINRFHTVNMELSHQKRRSGTSVYSSSVAPSDNLAVEPDCVGQRSRRYY